MQSIDSPFRLGDAVVAATGAAGEICRLRFERDAAGVERTIVGIRYLVSAPVYVPRCDVVGEDVREVIEEVDLAATAVELASVASPFVAAPAD